MDGGIVVLLRFSHVSIIQLTYSSGLVPGAAAAGAGTAAAGTGAAAGAATGATGARGASGTFFSTCNSQGIPRYKDLLPVVGILWVHQCPQSLFEKCHFG